MNETSPGPEEIEFYYHGFYRALRRYRMATIAGWVVVFTGVAGIPLGWNSGSLHGGLDILLCAVTIVAGLLVVSEAVSFLGTYVAVPFPAPPAAEGAGPEGGLIAEIRLIMKDVDGGGWQEAYAAIGMLERLGGRCGLPPPG
jgi:hypothetical protein